MVITLVDICRQLEVNLCERWSCHNWTCNLPGVSWCCALFDLFAGYLSDRRPDAEVEKRTYTCRGIRAIGCDWEWHLRSSKMQWIGAWRSTIWRFSVEFIFLRFQMFAACGWENLQVRLTSNTQGALRVTHKVSSDSAKEACNILFQVTDHFHFHFVSFSEFSWDFCVFFYSFLSWQPLGMWPSRCWLWWNQSARRREKDTAIIITHISISGIQRLGQTLKFVGYLAEWRLW